MQTHCGMGAACVVVLFECPTDGNDPNGTGRLTTISAQQNTGALKPVSRQLSRRLKKAFYRRHRNLTESSQTGLTVALLSQLHDSPQRRLRTSPRHLSDFPKNLQCRTSARKTLLTKNERSCQIHLAITHGACLKTVPQRALQAAIE
jgi:hypothetical protein